MDRRLVRQAEADLCSLREERQKSASKGNLN